MQQAASSTRSYSPDSFPVLPSVELHAGGELDLPALRTPGAGCWRAIPSCAPPLCGTASRKLCQRVEEKVELAARTARLGDHTAPEQEERLVRLFATRPANAARPPAGAAPAPGLSSAPPRTPGAWFWTFHQPAGWTAGPLQLLLAEALTPSTDGLRRGEAAPPAPVRPYGTISPAAERDPAQSEAFLAPQLAFHPADAARDRAPAEHDSGRRPSGIAFAATRHRPHPQSLRALARRSADLGHTWCKAPGACCSPATAASQDVLFGTTVSGRPATCRGRDHGRSVHQHSAPALAVGPAEPLLPWLGSCRTCWPPCGSTSIPRSTCCRDGATSAGRPVFDRPLCSRTPRGKGVR